MPRPNIPMNYVPKLWGAEFWHHNDPHYCMKTLVLKAGVRSSLHMHKVKFETFLVVSGRVILEYGDDLIILDKNRSFDIKPGVYHRFQCVTKTATVIEASTTHSEDDVFRIEESGPIPQGGLWTSKVRRQ